MCNCDSYFHACQTTVTEEHTVEIPRKLIGAAINELRLTAQGSELAAKLTAIYYGD